MIIKLTGADFSSNNIGKIEMPQQLHDYTIAAIKASGNTNMTEPQKIALNAFFLAMGVDGSNDAISKMRHIYLPMIAGDVSKALINYSTTEFALTKELTSEYWQLRNHGLVGVKSGQNITLSNQPVLQSNNFSCFFLRTELMNSGEDDTTRVFVQRGVTSTDRFLGIIQQSVSSDTGITFGSYGSWGTTYIAKRADSICAAYANSNADGWTAYLTSGVKVSGSPQTLDFSGETSATTYILGINDSNVNKPYAAILAGESVDDIIAENIRVAIDKLYLAFNV